MRETPIIGIVGWKNSGKTTLAVNLIATLCDRGFEVASLKHAHHTFDIDNGTQDSARHRAAGARQVAIVSPRRWALVSELDDEPEPDFDDVIAMLAPADVIVVEGYKSQSIPKIEARRREGSGRGGPMAPGDPDIIAIAADHGVKSDDLPVFELSDIDSIADFVMQRLALRPRAPALET